MSDPLAPYASSQPSVPQAIPPTGRFYLPGCPDPKRFPLWPGVAMAVLTAAGFAIFKFILISEIALDVEAARKSLPFEFMRIFLDHQGRIPLTEAVAQGLAAVFTVGILIGFTLNAPLAGAWRCGAMFVLSCLGMAGSTLLAIPGVINPWLAALLMGMTYGTACAARGKSVPLLAMGSGQHNTLVSGLINAGLVIGLLSGTIIGSGVALLFIGDPHSTTPSAGRWIDADWLAHLVLTGFLLLAAVIGMRLRMPEQQSVPFAQGMRELIGGTTLMVRRHWALLISGGIAWGITSALALASLVFCITELQIGQLKATFLGVAAGVGAIVGNVLSDHFAKRRWVIIGYLVLAALIFFAPSLIVGFKSGAIVMLVIGFVFMVPTNVIDARFLALAGREGLAGRGGTVFSMVHNVLILMVGTGLAVPLFTGHLTAAGQFKVLALCALVAMGIAACARLKDRHVDEA